MADAYYMNDERALVVESARDFVENEVRPLIDKMDRDDYFPVELFKRAGELGFLDINVPEEYGGNNLDLTTHCLIVEEIAKASAAFAMSFIADVGLAITIVNVLGTPEQKQRWLPGMVAGDLIGAHCTVEACGVGNMEAYSTQAVRDGEGWRINGHKCWSTNVGAAYLNIVKAYTDTPGVFSYFMVEADREGVTVDPPEDKVGWRGTNTGGITFDNVWVPDENVIGPIGKAVDISPQSIFHEMIATGAVALGIVEEANAKTMKYCGTRMHKSGMPFPFRYDVMRVRLMENLAKENAIRGMTYPVAIAYDAGTYDMVNAFLIKAACFKMAEEVTSTCIDLHGGVGVVKGVGLERLWRDAKVGLIGGGQYDFLLTTAGALRLSGRA